MSDCRYYRFSSDTVTYEPFGADDGVGVTLLPGEWVFSTKVAVPPMSAKQWQQAVPYALEDKLADNIEAMHVALGEYDEQAGKMPVLAVSRETMASVEATLEQANIQVAVALPDYLTLPWLPGQWTVWITETNRCLIRTGLQSGMAMPLALCATIITDLLDTKQLTLPDSVVAYSANNVILPPCFGENVAWSTSHLQPVTKTTERLLENPINLLQGLHRVTRKNRGIRKVWQPVLAACCALLLLGTAGRSVGIAWAKHKNTAVIARIATITKPIVGNAVDNPAPLIARQLIRLTREAKSDQFFKYLTPIGSILFKAHITMQGLVYKAGSMQITLPVVTSEQEATLTALFKAAHFSVWHKAGATLWTIKQGESHV